ncbi:enoyl-CoA hydratase-related protein [Spirillospora sp. CA-255316]
MRRFCDVTEDGQVLTVTIDRQERRNALDAEANHELGEVFDEFESDPRYRVAIVTGAGDKAFSAGADLRQAAWDSMPPVPASGFAGMTTRFGRAKPVIAAVNGTAVGGGFELALACDLVVAAEHATFGLTEPRVGLAALGGGVPRILRELGPKRAHGLLLTARKITAAEALDFGLVNEVVPHAELLAAARRWAADIVACSPASIRATKAMADAADGQSVQPSIAEMFALPAVKALFSGPDAAEGPRAFAEKRAPRWSPL